MEKPGKANKMSTFSGFLMAGDESFELSAYGLETVALPTELIPYILY